MDTPDTPVLPLRTPLYQAHLEAGGRMVEFAGYEMPIQYRGIVAEHKAVRAAVGLFDVSHMGQLFLNGPGAGEFLARMLVSDISKLPRGKARYTHLCDELARIIDDVIIYHTGDLKYLMVPNAATTARVKEWLEGHLPPSGVELSDQSFEWVCLALQGPKAKEVLRQILPLEGLKLPPFSVHRFPGHYGGLILARTGYTGEWGVELIAPAIQGPQLWARLMEVGTPLGMEPCGLGARDTLRLEKGYLLSGQDFKGERTSLETGCGWLIDWDHEFVGREALRSQKDTGYERLTGIKLSDRGVARPGCQVFHQGRQVSKLTSGGPSVMLKTSIGLTYLGSELRKVDTPVQVQVRGKSLNGRVVKLPFL